MSYPTASLHDTPPARPVLRRLFFDGSPGEALFVLILTLGALAVDVAGFLISTPLGLGLGFVLTLALSIWAPRHAPIVLVITFFFQNAVIAAFSPLVSGDDAFDTVRGTNFVVLITVFCVSLLATFLNPDRDLPDTKRWLRWALLSLLVILVFFAIGTVRGGPRDAVVYFRNTVTPIATFYIGLVAASRYRVNLGKGMALIGVIGVVYGYCELFFNFDFLSLFNGDRYIELAAVRQLDSGYWTKQLEQTGFVFLSLKDMMMTQLFNLNLFGPLPEVFRISGPPFHAISYAYGLSIISVWLIFQGKRLVPLLAFPLLVVAGSKGAMFMVIVALLVWVGRRAIAPKTLMLLSVAASAIWIGGALVLGMRNADYHVLGFVSGITHFVADPLGQGLGIGGNLASTTDASLDWQQAQAVGSTSVPVESAVGVMLYQMGIMSFVVFGFFGALAAISRRLYLSTRNAEFLFGFLAITVMLANAVLQEEAIYAPLAMGFCLLLLGVSLGNYWRDQADRRPSPPAPALTQP